MRKSTKNPTEKKRKKAVLLAKKISKILSKYTCEYCGRKKPQVAVHSHHIYSEGQYKSMSADVDNLISVCYYHHNPRWRTNEPSFHKTPQEMADWVLEKYPERMKTLKERSWNKPLCDEMYWDNKIEELKKQLETLDFFN